jgi:hypothetical protein
VPPLHLQNLLGNLTSWKMDNGAPMQEEDLKALRNAVEALEHPGLAARLSNLFGKPIEMIGGGASRGSVRVDRSCHHKGSQCGADSRSPHNAWPNPQ